MVPLNDETRKILIYFSPFYRMKNAENLDKSRFLAWIFGIIVGQ